jgi:HK97 family phage portal protein
MAVELAPSGPPLRARGRLVEQARRIARSLLVPLQGPYTSILITDDAGAWWLPVSTSTVLAISAVYRSLSLYSDLLGTLPVQRLRGETDERLPPPPFVAAPAGMPVGWTDEVGQVCWSLLLRGNAYCLATSYDWTGYPSTFVVLDPDRVIVERDQDGRHVYRWDAGSGAEVRLVDPSQLELLHIRWQRPPGAWCGAGILDTAGGPGSTLSGVSAAERYAADVMANPVPPAVLQHPLRLNKSQAEALQTQWSSSVARRQNVPAVLSGGVTYQPLQVTPRDVQLIESRQWNATQVAVLFGLPPYYVGGSTGDSLTYATVEGEMQRLWQLALMPMGVRLERAFGAWTPAGQRLRFVPDQLLRSQTLDRYRAHDIALKAGFMTADEVRALENRPPLEQTQTRQPAPAELEQEGETDDAE